MGRPAGRTMIAFECGHCGAPGLRAKGLEKEHMFCNQKCYLASDYHSETVKAALAAQRHDRVVTRPCKNCAVPVARHTYRNIKNHFCSTECRYAWQRRGTAIHVNSSGYVLVFVGRDYPGASKSGHILEHRKVMQESLGRPLLPAENVHHINGVKDDNRLENLELWSTSQPQGQRVADKIAWAREFLASYERLEREAHEAS